MSESSSVCVYVYMCVCAHVCVCHGVAGSGGVSSGCVYAFSGYVNFIK